MRKNAKYLLLTLLTFCFAVKVDAAECSYEKQVELNNLAATVKATYEEVEIDTGETVYYMDPETGVEDTSKTINVTEKGFKVSILNITNDIYVNVKNENTGESKDIYYRDTNNGTIQLDTYKADQLVTYTIKVYGLSECPGYDLRTITLVTPIFNPYYDTVFCEQYPNFELCSEYTTNTELTLDEFLRQSNEYRKNHNPVTSEIEKKESLSLIERIKQFFNTNKTIIIIIVCAIAIVGVATAAIIVIRRRSRLI